MHDLAEQIINVERAALDRWGKGDPGGYLEITATELSYFDPFTNQRIDSLDTFKQYLAPVIGKIQIDHYEIINPRVQQYGDIAILTFNLVDVVKQADSEKTMTLRWNSTEVYWRMGETWKIIHSHWSYTNPGS